MTVVFLHAFGGSARSWDLVAPSFRSVTPDLRGFGGSGAPEGAVDVDAYVRDVLGMVASIDEFLLVGHSMGGKFALATAAARPPGLRGLVLLAPSPPTPEPIPDRQAMLDGFGSRGYAERTVAQIARRPLAAEVWEATVEGYLAAKDWGWRGWVEVGSREDVSGRMGEVAVPTRILVGAGDPILGLETQEREVAGRLREGRIEVVPGAGHLLPAEAPEAVVAAIEGLLREV